MDRRLQPRAGHPRRRPGQERQHERLAGRRDRQAPQGAGPVGRCRAICAGCSRRCCAPIPRTACARWTRCWRGSAAAPRSRPPPPPRRRRRRRTRSRPARAPARRCCSAACSPRRSLAAAGAWYMLGDLSTAAVATATRSSRTRCGRPAIRSRRARNAINTALPSVSCTWLDIASIEGGSDGVQVAMRGVAGDVGAAQHELDQALTGAGLRNASLDFGDVAPITAGRLRRARHLPPGPGRRPTIRLTVPSRASR